MRRLLAEDKSGSSGGQHPRNGSGLDGTDVSSLSPRCERSDAPNGEEQGEKKKWSETRTLTTNRNSLDLRRTLRDISVDWWARVALGGRAVILGREMEIDSKEPPSRRRLPCGDEGLAAVLPRGVGRVDPTGIEPANGERRLSMREKMRDHNTTIQVRCCANVQ